MKSKSWTKRITLLLVIILASFLYFYKLDELPNSLSDDEATVGYNAYSILNTGRDEYGKSFPLAFRFFGAYTPPLYVYAIVPIMGWFGLNVVSVRVLSGFSTIAGVLIVYYFTKKLNIFKSPMIGVVAAFLFAISPWVVFYARIGYEVTFGYVVFSLGALWLWKGIAKNKLSLSGLVLLSLSTYIAHTERYLVPLFLLVVSVIFHKYVFTKRNRNFLMVGGALLLLTQIPNLYLLTTRAFWVKSSSFIASDFVSQLLTYFSPRAIFGIPPDINLQHTAPEIGLFYSWLIIPFFVGAYRLYLSIKTPGGKYLAILLLTAPIPGAFSGHFISVQRVLPLIIPLVLIMALGFDFLLSKIKPLIFWPLFFLLSAFSLLLLWRSYFVLFPKERFAYWSYGYEQLSEISKNNPGEKYIVDTARAGTVYSGLLFHLKYPPVEFQKQFSPDFTKNYYANPPVNLNYKIANVELRSITWEKDIFVDQVLVGDELTISTDQAREHFLEKAFEIKDPKGEPVLTGYGTNPEKKRLDNLAKEKRRKLPN